MHKLASTELTEIKGGASIGLALALIGVGAFLIGIIDGYLNPFKCRK